MSKTAAARLVTQGMVHCISLDHPEVLYANTSFWDEVYCDDCGSMGQDIHAIVAPGIHLNLLNFTPDMNGDYTPAAAAKHLLDSALTCRGIFQTNNPGKPFYWSAQISGFGGTYDFWYPDERVPTFSNHPDDCPSGILDSHRTVVPLFNGDGSVATGSTSSVIKVTDVTPWLNKINALESDYFTDPVPVKIRFAWDGDSDGDQEEGEISSVNLSTGDITLTAALAGTPPTSTVFYLSRIGQPSFFFAEGSAECATWTDAFMDEIANLCSGSPYSALEAPSAVIITTEDLNFGTAFFYECAMTDSAYTLNRADGRAEDGDAPYEHTIDGTRTLADWETERMLVMDSAGDWDTGTMPCLNNYDPEKFDWVSYMSATGCTAYSHHRNASTWSRIRSYGPWANTLLPQYQLAPGGTPEYPVPLWPGESLYHADPTVWNESVTWDEYYHLIDLIRAATKPVSSAAVEPVGGGSSLTEVEIPVPGSGPDPMASYTAGADDRIEFFGASALAHVAMYKVTGWNSMTRRLTIDGGAPMSQAPASGDTLRILRAIDRGGTSYTCGPYNGAPKWRNLSSYAQRAEEDGDPLDQTEFLKIIKGWAAETARQYSLGFPESPLCIFYSVGHGSQYSPLSSSSAAYDGNDEVVSSEYSFPQPSFTVKDGFLDGDDWGEIGTRAMNYGVNNLVWFAGEITDNTASGAAVRDAITTAIREVQEQYDTNLPIYDDIADACVADFNTSGTVTPQDLFDFLAAYFTATSTADVDDSGDVTAHDFFAFVNAYIGGCP